MRGQPAAHAGWLLGTVGPNHDRFAVSKGRSPDSQAEPFKLLRADVPGLKPETGLDNAFMVEIPPWSDCHHPHFADLYCNAPYVNAVGRNTQSASLSSPRIVIMFRWKSSTFSVEISTSMAILSKICAPSRNAPVRK